MKFNDYLLDVQRTWNKQSPELDEQHYTLGLINELGELASAFKKNIGYGDDIDKVNVLEECGDLLYFLCMQSIEFKEEMEKIGDLIVDGNLDKDHKLLYQDFDNESLYHRFFHLAYCINRSLLQENNRVNDLLMGIILNIKSILNDFGYTLQDCMERNVAKREARFPKGYEQNKAIDRDLNNERQILEATTVDANSKYIQGYDPYQFPESVFNKEKEINLEIQKATLSSNYPFDTNLISDGYHTFGELYEHRIQLFIKLCKWSIGYDGCTEKTWRSKVHSDDSVWEGWFILGLGVEKGVQITYHLPNKYWDECDFAQTLEKAPDWDGHTSQEVLERLSKLF